MLLYFPLFLKYLFIMLFNCKMYFLIMLLFLYNALLIHFRDINIYEQQ